MEAKYFRWWSQGDGICYSFRFPFPLHLFRGWKSGFNISEYKVIFVWKSANNQITPQDFLVLLKPKPQLLSFVKRMWCMRFLYSFFPNFLVNRYIPNLAFVFFLCWVSFSWLWAGEPSQAIAQQRGALAPGHVSAFYNVPHSPGWCFTNFSDINVSGTRQCWLWCKQVHSFPDGPHKEINNLIVQADSSSCSLPGLRSWWLHCWEMLNKQQRWKVR